MKQTSKRLVSIFIAIVLVAASILIFLEFIQPEYANMMSIKANLLGDQAFLASEQQSVSQVKTLLSTYETQSQSQSAESVALAIPNNEDLAGALAQIYGLAQQNNLTISGIGVSAPSIPASSAQPESASVVSPVNTLSFTVSGSGSYESLKNFLSGLETNARIFDLKSFSLNNIFQAGTNGKSTPASSEDDFGYSFNIATYYQTQTQTQ